MVDSMAMGSVIACGLLLSVTVAGVAAPVLIADVNLLPERIGANPTEMVAAGGMVFYTGEDQVHGRELWLTDGTEIGTRLVKDIRVGMAGSQPFHLRSVGSQIFFFANDGINGVRLWRSDGTNTVMAGDPSPGLDGFTPQLVQAAGGLLYYTDGPKPGSSNSFGWGLWRSDGSVDGTWLLNPSEGSGFPPYRPFGRAGLLTEMDGILFFSNSASELWRSGGTREETVRLASFGSGAQIVSMAGAAGQMWITLNRGDARELWTWTAGEVKMQASISDGALVTDRLTVRDCRAYFIAYTPNVGVELWTSDGSVTQRVDAISGEPGPLFPSGLTWCGETLYFTADDGIAGPGLWASDGVECRLVKSWEDGGDPEGLVASGGCLYFLRNEGGEVLWKSDGTDAGTIAMKQVTTPAMNYGSKSLMAEGGLLFFQGNDGQSGFELWSSDGTPDGTGMLRDLQTTQDGLINVDPGGVAAWGDDFVFRGNDGTAGDEPWRTDGTTAGTHMLADVWPGPEGSDLSRLASAGGNLYFSANDGVHGQELWRSDAQGSTMVLDLNPGNAWASISGPTAIGAKLVFVAQDATDSGLWITDGIDATKLKGKVGSQLTPFGGGLLFSAADVGYDQEPWWTDGITTRRIKDVRPGLLGSSPSSFTRIGNVAYFQASTDAGFRLWKTDGTESGTAQVGGWEGPGAVYPLVAAGDRLFFFEENVRTGKRLWVVRNGQAEFVRQIGTFGINVEIPATPYVEACGGLLFFVADDGLHGRELWRSDGTSAGTVMVNDVRPGLAGSDPVNLKTVGGRVFFQANDGISGEELWSTDGTAAGTWLVADLVPGSGGSAPGKMVLAGSRLFFSAVTEDAGCEPWVLGVGAILDFHNWTESAGLAGIAAAPNAAPQGDGVANLLKYAFGIDGASPYQSGLCGTPGSLPHFSTKADENGRILKVEYVRREESSLTYIAKRSANLVDGSFVPMSGEEFTETIGGGWERVVRTEHVDGGQCFGVIEVTQP